MLKGKKLIIAVMEREKMIKVYVEKLPSNCWTCVCEGDDDFCNLLGEGTPTTGKLSNCPLKEIVHCKDCKWYDWVDCNNPIVTAFPNGVRDEDNYCSFGERNE